MEWEAIRSLWWHRGEWKTLKELRYDNKHLHRPLFFRARVPGGWLVMMQNWLQKKKGGPETVDAPGMPVVGYGWGFGWAYGGLTFVPDPDHEWDPEEE